jgi:hypothetical protein
MQSPNKVFLWIFDDGSEKIEDKVQDITDSREQLRFDAEQVPPDWKLACKSMSSHDCPLILMGTPYDKAQYFNRQIHREILLPLILQKKWGIGKKPSKAKAIKLYLVWADYLVCILNLCQQVHNAESAYPNASNWFEAIFEEMLSSRPLDEGKDRLLKKMEHYSAVLTNRRNPVTDEQPHLKTLLAMAIDFIENHQAYTFERKFWKPLVKAHSNMSRALKSSEVKTLRHDLKSGRPYYIQGKRQQVFLEVENL